jgi:hypothetical protein
MALIATIDDPFVRTLIAERDCALERNRELEDTLQAAHDVLMSVCDTAAERNDAAVQTIQRLSDECEQQANDNDVLLTLIRTINEIYINMDLPGLMSWDERTRKRVEIVNDVNMLLAGME